MPKFQIFQDTGLQWRWRLIAGNGEIVATSEAYVSQHNAERSAKRVKEIAAVALLT